MVQKQIMKNLPKKQHEYVNLFSQVDLILLVLQLEIGPILPCSGRPHDEPQRMKVRSPMMQIEARQRTWAEIIRNFQSDSVVSPCFSPVFWTKKCSNLSNPGVVEKTTPQPLKDELQEVRKCEQQPFDFWRFSNFIKTYGGWNGWNHAKNDQNTIFGRDNSKDQAAPRRFWVRFETNRLCQITVRISEAKEWTLHRKAGFDLTKIRISPGKDMTTWLRKRLQQPQVLLLRRRPRVKWDIIKRSHIAGQFGMYSIPQGAYHFPQPSWGP